VHYAIEESLDSIITSIIEMHPNAVHDIECVFTNTKPLLLFATSRANANAVKSLLATGLDPNITDNLGNTCLHFACEVGNLDIVSALLDASACPNAADTTYGLTPLHRAANHGACDVAELLVSSGADPLICDTLAGNIPREYAVMQGHKSIVALLTANTPSEPGSLCCRQ
jgi:ankyrin repeat protein